MIPKETAQKILDAAKLVEIIADFSTLKKSGSSFSTKCPSVK